MPILLSFDRAIFSSLIPNFLVSGIKEAFLETKATIVYVLNLMTKYGQTYQFSAQDHMDALERYVGRDRKSVV